MEVWVVLYRNFQPTTKKKTKFGIVLPARDFNAKRYQKYPQRGDPQLVVDYLEDNPFQENQGRNDCKCSELFR